MNSNRLARSFSALALTGSALVACGEDVTARMDSGITRSDVARTDATQPGNDSSAAAMDAAPNDSGAPRDSGVSCPMPPPAYVFENGRCVPSCTAAGGNTCSATACAGRAMIEAYDCATCCVVPPSNCGGVPTNWVCTTDGRSRQRCASNMLQTEMCANSCVPGSGTSDATCSAAMSTCTGSASGNSPTWTCTSDRRSRQRCISSMVQTEACANGCVPNAVGTDDTCASAPAGCTGSASGTSSVWTCTSDRRSRQRCVSNAVQTEACSNGCVTQPIGTDDYCATTGSGCSGSASGTSSVWTCTSDNTARQRCVSNSVQTEACMYGCARQPVGTDDTCLPMPMPGSGQPNCAYPQWWTLPYSWDPGYYAVRYGWDSDLRMAAGTPVQLRHASRLISEAVYAWGWMPEFQDTVTGQRFRFLHLQPSRRLTTAVGTTYPAGTLVGYSGGGTADTGYCVAIPGCSPVNCAAASCVYSTGAHLCVQTQVAYRTAFPNSMDACR